MMKHYGVFGFILVSALCAVPARAESTSPVIFSEINWAGSPTSTADEWLELVNLSPESIDLSGWIITGAASSGGAIQIAEGTTIQPKSTLLIANYDLNDPKTTLAQKPDLVTSALSLPNSGLTLLLTHPDGVVVDSVHENIGATNPSTSMERDLATLLWLPALQSTHLLQTTQQGTPGSVTFSTPATPTDYSEPTTENDSNVSLELEDSVSVTQPELIHNDTQNLETNTSCTPIIPSEDTLNIPPPSIQPMTNDEEITELSPSVPALPHTEESEADTSIVQNIPLGLLLMNELVSDPVDDLEWVEIWNKSSIEIDLTGYSLRDAGNHLTPLPATSMQPDTYILVTNPVGNLNNSGDTITLLSPDGTVLDSVTYGAHENPAPADGEALARTSDDAWSITTPTPTAPNVFPVDLVASDLTPEMSTTDPISYETVSDIISEAPSDTSHSPLDTSGTAQGTVEKTDHSTITGTQPVHRIVATAERVTEKETKKKPGRASRKNEEQKSLEGVITALPGIFGKQTLFLNGYEIYFHAADWPVLSIGDVIQINAKQSTKDGHDLWKISRADDITVLRHEEIETRQIDSLEGITHGILVTITGQLTRKDLLTLPHGETVNLTFSKTIGRSPSFSAGEATITGIVRIHDGSTKLAIRSWDDITVTTTEATTPLVEHAPNRGPSPLLGGGLLTGSLGALGTWYLRARRLASTILPV